MEPTTFTAIVATLSAGVAAGVGKVGESALVDAYQELKAALKRQFGDNSEVVKAVDQLEQKPDSEGRKGMLRKEVEAVGADGDPDILQAAQQLLEQLKAQPGGEQHIQHARGSYIAQADRGSTATVDVNRSRDTITVGDIAGSQGIAIGRIARAAAESRISERRISVWVSERSEGPNAPLIVDESYTLNFKVGRPVQASLISGPETEIPPSDVPRGGLETEWVISSTTVELVPLTPEASTASTPTGSSVMWTAALPLRIPEQGDSSSTVEWTRNRWQWVKRWHKPDCFSGPNTRISEGFSTPTSISTSCSWRKMRRLSP
jgi:hypothetical protein